MGRRKRKTYARRRGTSSGNSKGLHPYKSQLEKRVARVLGKRAQYEPKKVQYLCPKTYTTDFILTTHKHTSGPLETWIEAKGRFRTSEEAAKYIHIREQHPDVRFVFVFQRSGVFMPGAKPRKDGTKRTMEEWAESHGFEYVFENKLRAWLRENAA